jgi:hypothetical protein
MRFIQPFTSKSISPLHNVESVKQIKSYADPTVFLSGIILEFERDAETVPFERQLADAAEVTPDNKVIYEITTEDGFKFYVKLHDTKITYALAARSR